MKIKGKEIDLVEWHKAGLKTNVDYQDELIEIWYKNRENKIFA